ncbi:hypothetical protein B0H19DRAFT_1188431 [Mycena capillaripes]|nr:hypothetical protein B0H19DRAFT_1188431 [Mycena capillaripes]
MFLLHSRRVGSRRVFFCRGVTAYSPKVRAFPFKISPEQAIFQLSICAAAGGDVLTRVITRFGAPPIQPVKIVPVYFPAWFIDAEVEAKVTTSAGSMDGYITGVFLNSYLPGHTMEKLSSISLLSGSLAFQETVPFSENLETQFDTKITCLPFRTVPFSILDAAKSLKTEDCRINRGFLVDPSSIATKLISAYPVLIPLYLAQYARGTTVVVEAHREMGRIFEEIPFAPAEESDTTSSSTENTPRPGVRQPQFDSPIQRFFLRTLERIEEQVEHIENQMADQTTLKEGAATLEKGETEELDGVPFFYHRGSPAPFINVSAITIPPTWEKWHIAEDFLHLRKWLHNFITTKAFQRTGDDKMEDPRIRPFTSEELSVVRFFLKLGQERANAHGVLEHISKVTTTAPVAPEDAHQELKKYVASFDARRDQATPSWWREWQKSRTK